MSEKDSRPTNFNEMKSENKNMLIQNNIDSADKGYCNLRDRGDIPRVAKAKGYCESLWEIYRDYADPRSFKKNFAKDFRARFWEMYLTCSLIESGFPVFKGKKSSEGPDICLKLEQGDVWIEAVAPDVGDAKSDDKVPDYELNYVLTKEPKKEVKWLEEDKIILRYRSVIKEKLKKYKGYIENSIIQPQQPYIIAINSSKIPYAFINLPLPLIVKAVFPFGSPFVYIDENFELLEESFSYKDKIVKSNRSEVKTDIFLNTDHSGISGILYSALSLERASEDNAFGKASSEGYIFIHNPLATNKLPRGFFKNGIEYFMEGRKLCCLNA